MLVFVSIVLVEIMIVDMLGVEFGVFVIFCEERYDIIKLYMYLFFNYIKVI